MIKARRAFDHVGMAVPDLDQAVDFFVDALGFDVVIKAGSPSQNAGRCVRRTWCSVIRSISSSSNTRTALWTYEPGTTTRRSGGRLILQCSGKG